jgi:hypothetical protein
MKNSFVTNQAVNKPKKSNSNIGNISNVPNMGLTSNIQSRNIGMRRKSRLQFKRVPNENTGETEQIIHEKYGSKTSSNLGQIKEENRENNSQATIRNDSRDPRQKSTPRVEEHKGDQEIDIYHETQDDEEVKGKIFSKNFVSFLGSREDQKLKYYDTEVIQHIHAQYQIPIEELFRKLQLGDSEAIDLYEKWVQTKSKTMKTVYPNVIHSAISSPQNSRGSAIGMFYISPEDSGSNPRNSHKDLEMGNYLLTLRLLNLIYYF